jgi:ribosome-associated protein
VSGNSTPHLRALAEECEISLKNDGMKCYRKSGSAESGWILLDFVDVVVHFMTEETREYYALEQLWNDAPKVELAG